jgi:hypothetical protein
MAERYFNREEAEELLPLIGDCLTQALDQKKSIEEIDQALAQASARIMMLGGSIPSSAEFARHKTERDAVISKLQETVNRIQQTGCVIKDLDIGLVDFPSLRHGEEVYLCWKLGEPRIDFYHGLNEGFAGRKPLDDNEADDSGSRLH